MGCVWLNSRSEVGCVFTTIEKPTTLTTLRYMKARAGLPVPPYESSEHEDSVLYVDELGCVKIPIGRPIILLNSAATNEVVTRAALPIMLLEVAETDEPEFINHSTLCKFISSQSGRDFIKGRGEDLRSHLMRT